MDWEDEDIPDGIDPRTAPRTIWTLGDPLPDLSPADEPGFSLPIQTRSNSNEASR